MLIISRHLFIQIGVNTYHRVIRSFLSDGTMVNPVSLEATRRLGFVSSPKLDGDDVDDLDLGSSVGTSLPCIVRSQF